MDSVAIVLEHDDALFLHGQREFFGIAVVVDSLGGLQLDVGVLVQAALELGQQEVIGGVAQDLQRLVLSQLILHKLKAVGSSVQIRGTAHLVDAVHVELGKTLGNCQVLYAEGLGAVDGDLPVCENKALVVVLPQQADFVLGIGPADPLAQFMVAFVGDGVVGHDAGFMGNALGQVESTVKERDQMGSKVIAREYIELAAVAVVVAAALSGACAHVMLGDSVDGVNAPAQVGTVLSPGALQSGDVSVGQVAAQSRVLGIGACRAGQNRGRADVDLGSQQHGDADGAVHLAVSNAQRKGRVHVKGGTQGQLVDGVGDIAGINGHGSGDAPVARGFAESLQGVGPCDSHGGTAGVGSAAGHTAAAAVLNIFQICSFNFRPEAHPSAVCEERDHLLHTQEIGQITGAGLVVQTPVLVRIQLAVAVQILEGIAVRLNQLYAGVSGIAQGLPALIEDLDPAVVGGFLGPLLAVGIGGGSQCQHHSHGQKKCENLSHFIHAVFSLYLIFLVCAVFRFRSHHISLKNLFQGLLEHRLYVLKNSGFSWTKRRKTGRMTLRPVYFTKKKGTPQRLRRT